MSDIAQDLGGVVLLSCPFCGGHAVVDASSRSDERSGYNFSVHIACVPCHVKLTIASGYDKNGWCNESLASVTSRAIAAWNTRANSAGIAGALRDAERLDYIERTFTGMSNGERYLPLVMGWGKSRNGRTLREACDKYMAKEGK